MLLFGPPNVEKMKAKRDVKGLINALGYQKDFSVRMWAASGLGQIGDARAVAPLISALKDSDSGVRKRAADALVKIGAGAHVNQGEPSGLTPLLIAGIKGDTGLIELLVGAGADVNQRDVSGLTPLHMAVRADEPEAVRTLVRLGAAIDARDQLAGYTPLHCAALAGAGPGHQCPSRGRGGVGGEVCPTRPHTPFGCRFGSAD